ncbi:3-methyl-2-oxobutanoate hydroxymethyltransferase [Spirochaeta lutea]|uniref:3-methyl-2-oxobutanoate hydroxymethyltransferase n=1 Tax=Spirochaeta lutea TaxID=1480694 RepID=UPI0009DF114A|nr:3-methyl-2-oxobutanoate hydroxymethyltransferase [Spirochaeta lutea]
MRKLTQFPQAKARGEILSVLTCYDAWSAALLQDSGLDAVLVGDSLAMVMYGGDSTLTADMELMTAHVRAVRRGGPGLTIIADMPFLSTRCGLDLATRNAGDLMRAGADGVKIEGLEGHVELIPHLIASGIPVMGHLGLTPQAVHTLGGYRVQGRDAEARRRMVDRARQLEELGCFALVAEGIPSDLGRELAGTLGIPVIGIGAGPDVDGQVLVLQDMLGLTPGAEEGRLPRFVRQYLPGGRLVRQAVDEFVRDVRSGDFPSARESYGGNPESKAGAHDRAPKQAKDQPQNRPQDRRQDPAWAEEQGAVYG